MIAIEFAAAAARPSDRPMCSSASSPALATTSAETPNATVRALWTVAAAAVLIPVLLFVGAALEDRSAVLHRAEQDGRKTVALLHEQATNLLGGHEIILDTIVDRVRGYDWATIESSHDLLNELERIDKRLDDISAIVLADASGKVRVATPSSTASGARAVADRDCFMALSAGRSTSCVSGPTLGHDLFSLCRRLEAGGRFDGVAQVAISVDYFLDLWKAVAPNPAATVMLLRDDGVVLAQYPRREKQALRLSRNAPVMTGLKQGGEGIVRAPELPGDAGQITLYKKVSSYPVYISLGLDKNAILAEWYRNLLVYGAVTLAATLGLVAAIGVALRRARRERRAVALWRAEVVEREATQQKLVESQIMERLGQKQIAVQRDFIADAAHELRTPLSVLRIRVDTMKHQQQIAQSLRSDIGGMTRTVNQLLEIALSEILEVQPDDRADLYGVCSEIVAELAPLALADGKEVALTGTEDPVWVRGNVGSLLHAVRNLVENAIAHTAVGTTVEVDVDPAGIIRVGDFGPGVAEHERELVFRRFWRRDRRSTGSAGLGLSIVSRIVEAHGGSISVGDHAAGGAVFTLSLTAARVSDPQPATGDKSSRKALVMAEPL